MKKLGLIGSIVAALASAGLGHLYLQRLEAEVSGGPKVPVLVAVKDIPVAAALTKSALAVRDVPRAYVESRHVEASELEKVLGARVAGGLKANEALLWSDLGKFNEHARMLSGLVQRGMRAVAIDGRSSDFDGLLRPGDRVDVLYTAEGQGASPGSTVTLLQNLIVLSVGDDMERGDDEEAKDKRYSKGGAVTVSATVEQAQVLTQAKHRGRLTLTLRTPDDVTLVEDLPETTRANLTQVHAEVQKGIHHVR